MGLTPEFEVDSGPASELNLASVFSPAR
jgi:hypothetical protein